jgi:hypothetical protein
VRRTSYRLLSGIIGLGGAGGLRAEDGKTIELAPVPGAEVYRGVIESGGRSMRFQTREPWIIVPSDATVSHVRALDPMGRPVGEEVVTKVQPPRLPPEAPVVEAPPPAKKPEAAEAAQTPAEEPKPEEPLVKILPYKAEWTRIGRIALAVGFRRESSKAEGGISEYEASHTAFPITLSLGNAVDWDTRVAFGVDLTHASYKQEIDESVGGEDGDFPERKETIGLDGQQVWARYRFASGGAERWRAVAVGAALRLTHSHVLEPVDDGSGTGEVVRQHVGALALEAGYDQMLTRSFGVGALLTLAPNATTFARDVTLWELGLRGTYHIDADWRVFAGLQWRQAEWHATFSCPAAAAACKKDGQTDTKTLDALVGVDTNLYLP